MTDEQLLRYSRHILLDQIGIEGQQRLLNSHALIIGAGGLGSPAALYMASAGIGKITLVDDDEVDFTNLQRQILHTQDRVGMAKVDSGKVALQAINSSIEINTLQKRLSGLALDQLIEKSTLILDCTDNFATRHAINRACVHHKKPLISGAAIRFDGQISVYDLSRDDSPCYHCLFPEAEDVDTVRCATMGVFSPLTGIIGTMQAAEALKLAAGIGENLSGRLLLLDALDMSWRTVKFKKDPACAVCGASKNGQAPGYLPRSDVNHESPIGACSLN